LKNAIIGVKIGSRLEIRVGSVGCEFFLALAESLESLRKQPDSGGWIAYAAVTIGFSFVAIYWGRWWYRRNGISLTVVSRDHC
jgi:hypothetical protein